MVKAKRRAQGAKGKEERIFDRKEHKGHKGRESLLKEYRDLITKGRATALRVESGDEGFGVQWVGHDKAFFHRKGHKGHKVFKTFKMFKT